MKYKTNSNVAPHSPARLKVPKVSLCFSLYELMGAKNEKSFSFQFSIPPFINMTFTQVLESMPKSSDTLHSCKYRDFVSDILFEEKDGKKCMEKFKVTRFRMQSFMCYKYEMINAPEYSFHGLVNSLYEPRELFNLNMKSPLGDGYVFYPLIHFDEFPDDDRVFNQESYKGSHSLFHVSYDFYEWESLPSPYETHCVNISKVGCYQKCMENEAMKYGFSYDGAIVIENSSASFMISTPLNSNKKFSRTGCHDQCQHEACVDKVVNSRITRAFPSVDNLQITIETLNNPITKIQYVAQSDLYNFFTQSASIIGIWTGISVVIAADVFTSERNIPLKILKRKIISLYFIVHTINSRIRGKRSLWRTVKTKKRKRFKYAFISWVIKCFVFICFLVQVYNVMQEYFMYKTTVKLKYNMNPKLDVPSLSICVPIEYFYGFEPLDEVTEENYHEKFIERDLKLNFTFETLMEDNFIKKIFKGCFIRRWSGRFKKFHRDNHTECLNHFKLNKYFYNQKMCLLISPLMNNLSYHQSDVRFLAQQPGILYSIVGSKKYFPNEIQLLLTMTQFIPKHSIEYVSSISSLQSRNNNNMYVISSRKYIKNLLQPPYDTFCSTNSGKNNCLQKCINSALSKFKRVSYHSIEERIFPYRILSYTDLLDEKMNKIWVKTENECKKSCFQDQCRHSLSLTFLESRTHNKDIYKDEIIIAILVDSYPVSEMTIEPMTTFFVSIYQFFCCCSFWLGFAVIDTNPITFVINRRNKRLKDDINSKFLKLKNSVEKLLGAKKFNFKKNTGKFYSLVMKVIISILCFLHILHSMKIYFTYSLVIDVYQHSDTSTSYNLYICLDSSQLISRKLKVSNFTGSVEEKSIIFSRTISSLFEDLPKGEELIERCAHWGLNKRQGLIKNMSHISDRVLFTYSNKTICQKRFKFNRFVLQSSMCYGFRPFNYTYWDREQIKSTLHNQQTLFKISINSKFLTNKFSFAIDKDHFIPKSSSIWAPINIKDKNFNHFEVSYISYFHSILPSTYPTNGFNHFTFDSCVSECINDKLLQFNKTLSTRLEEPSHLKFITYFDRKSFLAGTYLNRLLEMCEKHCSEYINDSIYQDTFEIYKPTYFIKNNEKSAYNLTTFDLKITKNPAFKVIFTVRISFVEQLINVGSIISIWFGFAMIKLSKLKFKSSRISLEEIAYFEFKLNKLRHSRGKLTSI